MATDGGDGLFRIVSMLGGYGQKTEYGQAARFERFCEALIGNFRLTAYQAALKAGYTRRMAKSKSYELTQRAWKRAGFRKAGRRAADAYAAEQNREYFLQRANVGANSEKLGEWPKDGRKLLKKAKVEKLSREHEKPRTAG